MGVMSIYRLMMYTKDELKLTTSISGNQWYTGKDSWAGLNEDAIKSCFGISDLGDDKLDLIVSEQQCNRFFYRLFRAMGVPVDILVYAGCCNTDESIRGTNKWVGNMDADPTLVNSFSSLSSGMQGILKKYKTAIDTYISINRVYADHSFTRCVDSSHKVPGWFSVVAVGAGGGGRGGHLALGADYYNSSTVAHTGMMWYTMEESCRQHIQGLCVDDRFDNEIRQALKHSVISYVHPGHNGKGGKCTEVSLSSGILRARGGSGGGSPIVFRWKKSETRQVPRSETIINYGPGPSGSRVETGRTTITRWVYETYETCSYLPSRFNGSLVRSFDRENIDCGSTSSNAIAISRNVLSKLGIYGISYGSLGLGGNAGNDTVYERRTDTGWGSIFEYSRIPGGNGAVVCTKLEYQATPQVIAPYVDEQSYGAGGGYETGYIEGRYRSYWEWDGKPHYAWTGFRNGRSRGDGSQADRFQGKHGGCGAKFTVKLWN